jgi:DNA-binding NtrC family response regulator
MGCHVLIIEDDHDTADMISLLLIDHGYEVRTVPDRDAGLEWIAKGWPQVILLDMRTEGQPIQYLIAETTRVLPKARIILISATGNLAVVAQALGLRFFLEKPFDPEALLALIDDARKSGEHANV